MTSESFTIALGTGQVAVVDVSGPQKSRQSVVTIVPVDGGPIRSITLPGAIGAGVFVGDQLIVSGDGVDDRTAPAVEAIGPDDTVRTLLPEGPIPEDWTGIAPGRTLVASTSGRTLVAGLCIYGRTDCRVTVIELPDGRVRDSFEIPGFPRPFGFGGATDELMTFGSDPASTIGALDLGTGEVRWTLKADSFWQGYLTADGRLVQQSYESGATDIIAVEMTTGRGRTVWSAPIDEAPVLWPELSSDSVAVLGTGGTLVDAGAADAIVSLDLLDVGSGGLTDDGYELALDQ
jgi:hypothetical protein